MKTNKFLAVMALAGAVAFTSCNVEDNIQNDNGAVRFNAGIEKAATAKGLPGTRAAETAWANGDPIGVFMVADNSTTVVEGAENRLYTANPAGQLSTTTPIYYPMDNSVVDFIAYYPHVAGAVLTTPIAVTIETTQTADNQPDFDLLYSNNGTGRKSTAATAVALNFDHKLAKIVMDCTADASVGAAALVGMAVKINGMNTVSTFDLSDGTLGATGTLAPITPRTVTDGVSYNAIILPAAATAAAGDVSVDFTINPNTPNAETFTWKLPAGTDFVAGNEYTYTVTITRTGVTAEGTINPWTTNDRGGVIAE